MIAVIINGKGGTGKDTFIDYVRESTDKAVFNLSSVSYVKAAAYDLGWDGTKTPENRKFLSDLKKIMTAWGDRPFRLLCNYILGLSPINVGALFIHIREPEEITRMKNFLSEEGIECITLLVKRDGVPESYGNDSDDGVDNYTYDLVLHNRGDLSALKNNAVLFTKRYIDTE